MREADGAQCRDHTGNHTLSTSFQYDTGPNDTQII
jgi:hypothetical protein